VSRPPIVCDTTLLLYLGRIGRLDLLPALFDPVHIPQAVVLELDMGRLVRQDTINPRTLEWARLVSVPPDLVASLPPNRLGTGERAVIAHALAYPGCIAGLDDLQARRLAESLNLTVVGTIGLLLRSKHAGLIPTVQPLLDAVVAGGFHLHPTLYQVALDLAGERPAGPAET